MNERNKKNYPWWSGRWVGGVIVNRDLKVMSTLGADITSFRLYLEDLDLENDRGKIMENGKIVLLSLISQNL